MRLQKTVVIDKPRDAVFDYLSDFTTATEWDPGTVLTVNHHGDGGTGTTYLNTSTFLGRKTQLTYIVREFIPGKRIRLPQHRCRHRGHLHSRVHLQRLIPPPRPAAQARLRTAGQTSAGRHAHSAKPALTNQVRPLTYSGLTISSAPVRRRYRLRTICGSNEPSRSHGRAVGCQKSACPVSCSDD
jgi:hypothetical protein